MLNRRNLLPYLVTRSRELPREIGSGSFCTDLPATHANPNRTSGGDDIAPMSQPTSFVETIYTLPKRLSQQLVIDFRSDVELSFLRIALAYQARMSSLRRRQRIHNGREVSAPAGPTTFGRGGLASGTVRPAVLLLARTLFVPLASAAPLSLWQHSSIGTLEDDVDSPKSPDDPNLWAYLGVAVALVLLGGAFAGLTIALMGQDETYLQVIATSGEGSEKKHANKVLNLLKRGKHWVLVTLLLSNVITNETLPIVLDRSLGGGWPAVLSSTVLIGTSPPSQRLG